MKRTIAIFICVFAMVFAITCTNLTNPFLNKNESKAEITSRNSANSDSVEMFSTQIVSVSVFFKEHIDSIKMHIDNNRLLNSFDTLVTRENIRNYLTFPFSFYKTGKQNIRLISYINNGDSVIDTSSLYSVTPLTQKSISGSVGDSIFLKTTPVKDKVIYVWDFHNNIVIKDFNSSVGIKVSAPFTNYEGELYVEDFSKHRSPSVVFQINNIQSELELTCINDSTKADSVYSRNAELKFSIQVSGATKLTSAKINGKSFDDSLKTRDIFSLNYTLKNLDTIYAPLALTVSVTDNLGRSINKMFFVHYIKSDPMINVLYPAGDSMSTAASMISVQGNVTNIRLYNRLYLFAKNNGKVQSKMAITQDKPVFSFEVSLPSFSNHISLELYSDSLMSGSLLSLSHFYVFYNQAYIDTLPPQIRNILCNGKPVTSFFISRTDTMQLEIDAVDNSNKLSVFVNDSKIQKNSDQLFYTTNVFLKHQKDSTIIAIKAIDSSDYSSNDSIYLIYNQLPKWINTPAYSIITAGKESEFKIVAADPDNDSLFITMSINSETKDTLLNASSGQVLWHPQISDTGEYNVELSAWDGFEYIDTNFIIVVKGNGAVPVKLLKENIVFPDTLFVQDSLHVILHKIPLTGTSPFSYSAFFINDSSKIVINGTDSVIDWIPTVADIGMRTLRVIIKDSLEYKDSMDVNIQVIKKIMAHLRWKQNSSQFHEGSLENTFPSIIISPPLNFEVKIPYTISFSKDSSTANEFDIQSPISGIITFNANEETSTTTILSIIDDTIPEYTEKFELRLSDNDTIKFCDSCKKVFNGEIIDNDLVTFYFEETEVDGLEGSKNLIATVNLSNSLETSLELYYEVDTINSTAKTGKDFNFTSSFHRVVFNPGETQAQINIDIIDDHMYEANETIILKLLSATAFAKSKDSANFIYTIMNDDSAAHYSFTTPEASGSESDTEITIKVTLDKKYDSTIVIKCSINGDHLKTTATKDIDFTFLDNSDVLTFNVGDTVKFIKIAIEDDTLPELVDEFFTLKLQSENDFAIPGKFTSHKYTILRNEVRAFFASTTIQTADEKNYRTPYCEIMLATALDKALTVHFVVEGRSTAKLGSDFTMNAPGFVTFGPGEIEKDVGIIIIDDNKAESTEHIYLKITDVSDKKKSYFEESNNAHIAITSN